MDCGAAPTGEDANRGYIRIVSTYRSPRGRHRLDRSVAHPAAITRSASVVAATVGTVLALAAPSQNSSPLPHPDAPRPSGPLQPVVLEPRADAPASSVVTGDALVAAHRAAAAALSAAGRECEDHLAA